MAINALVKCLYSTGVHVSTPAGIKQEGWDADGVRTSYITLLGRRIKRQFRDLVSRP
jgi:hypothetical protein